MEGQKLCTHQEIAQEAIDFYTKLLDTEDNRVGGSFVVECRHPQL